MSKVNQRSLEEELDGCLKVFEFSSLQLFPLKTLTAKNLDEKPSVLRLIYLVGLLLGSSSLMATYMCQYQGERAGEIVYKNSLMVIVQYATNVGMFLVIWISLVQSYLKNKMTKQIFLENRQFVNLSWQEFEIDIDFKKIRKSTWIQFFSIVGFAAVAHSSLIIFSSDDFEEVPKIAIGVLPILVIVLVVFKFVFYVGMVNSELEFLMSLLENIFTVKPIAMLDIIHSNLTTVKSARNNVDPLKKFRAASKLYNIIFDISNLINDSLGLTVLVLLASAVIALTGTGYELYVIILGEKTARPVSDILYVVVLGQAMLGLIIGHCQKTQTIMSKLATSLKRIESENYGQLSYECREFLQNFYLQMIHQPIVFTAFRFYTINFNLLASVCTGIVSYQIILVQFNST